MCNTTEQSKDYVTHAPPPLSAVASILLFIGIAIARFPSLESIDQVATVEAFTRRIFPHLVSLDALIFIRFAFSAFILYISIEVTFFAKGWELKPSYLPKSKLRKEHHPNAGIRTQFPYTSLTWNLLGLSFGLSTYIAYIARNGQDVNQWILRAALLTWETVARVRCFVSSIVRYVLWPTALKYGTTAGCKSRRSLIWHNANSAMTLMEVAFLGGLPVQPGHEMLGVLLASVYTIFSWLYMYHWVPGQGPSFIYFFFDTTLGPSTTIGLYALAAVFLVVYILFSVATQWFEHSGRNLIASVLFATLVFRAVCRFQD
jgi:hypothetical protein